MQLKRITSPFQLPGDILGCRRGRFDVGCMDPTWDAINLDGGRTCQEHQVGSLPSGFEIAGSMTPDQDRVSHLELMWYSCGSRFVCSFKLFPGTLSDQFKSL